MYTSQLLIAFCNRGEIHCESYMHIIVIYTCPIFSCKIQHAMRGVLYYFAY